MSESQREFLGKGLSNSMTDTIPIDERQEGRQWVAACTLAAVDHRVGDRAPRP